VRDRAKVAGRPDHTACGASKERGSGAHGRRYGQETGGGELHCDSNLDKTHPSTSIERDAGAGTMGEGATIRTVSFGDGSSLVSGQCRLGSFCCQEIRGCCFISYTLSFAKLIFYLHGSSMT